MIFHQHDYNLRAPVPVEVPDDLIHDFMRWIIETNTWRERPELVMDRLISLRKKLLAAAVPVPSVLPEDDEPIDAQPEHNIPSARRSNRRS